MKADQNFLDMEMRVAFYYCLSYLVLVGLAFLTFCVYCLINWKKKPLQSILERSVFGEISYSRRLMHLLYFLFLFCNFILPILSRFSVVLWRMDSISYYCFAVIQTISTGFVFCPIFIFSLYSVQWEYTGTGVQAVLSVEERETNMLIAIKNSAILSALLVIMNGILVCFWNSQSRYYDTNEMILMTLLVNIVLFFLCIQRCQLTRRGEYRAQKLHLNYNKLAKYHAILKAHLDFHQSPVEFIRKAPDSSEWTSQEMLQHVSEKIDLSLHLIRTTASKLVSVIEQTFHEGDLIPILPVTNFLNKYFISFLSVGACFTAAFSFLEALTFRLLPDDKRRFIWLTFAMSGLDVCVIIYSIILAPMMYCIIKDKDIWGARASFSSGTESPLSIQKTRTLILNNPALNLQPLIHNEEGGSDHSLYSKHSANEA